MLFWSVRARIGELVRRWERTPRKCVLVFYIPLLLHYVALLHPAVVRRRTRDRRLRLGGLWSIRMVRVRSRCGVHSRDGIFLTLWRDSCRPTPFNRILLKFPIIRQTFQRIWQVFRAFDTVRFGNPGSSTGFAWPIKHSLHALVYPLSVSAGFQRDD